MTTQDLSAVEIEQCQKTILEFMPPPVTNKQREALERYQDSDLEGLLATLDLGGDFEHSLCCLLKAQQNDSSAVECLNEATDSAIRFAGAADGSEIYAKLGEILPEQFSEKGAR